MKIPGIFQNLSQWTTAFRIFSVLLVTTLAAVSIPARGKAQNENLFNRISNEKMMAFEERLTESLNVSISRYISRRQYVLSVKVIWNPDIVPIIENPELAPTKQKLPGFPIFVRSPDSPPVDGGTPPFTRLEVKVLIDETLPEYYERFVRKIVPIVSRMDFTRGDQVVVLKETFPVLPKEEELPPTLSEKEMMDLLGEKPGTERDRPRIIEDRPRSQPPTTILNLGGGTVQQGPAGQMSPLEAAVMAYEEKRYPVALRIVQVAFQKATTNPERARYLAMEGSILYTMNNVEGARASWQRAISYDPSNMEVHEVLNFLDEENK